jgi:uncharacterized membrane protein (UPF0127 family)
VGAKSAIGDDTSGVHVSLDLFFLDSDYLAVAEAKSLRPDGSCPEMKEVVGVLELAAGTIRPSQTEKGDHMSRSIRAPTANPRVRAAPLLGVSDS